MALNLNRWIAYAKAKLDDTLRSGHAEMDELEAEQQAAAADRPWIGATDAAPSFEEAKARIAWEQRTAEEQAGHEPATPPPTPPPTTDTDTAETPAGPADVETPTPTPTATPAEDGVITGAGFFDPLDAAGAAEREAARLELEERQRTSADRLAAIRRELGVDDPPAAGGS